MKKAILGLFLLLFTTCIFGQSYNDYLKKAKDFEGKKQWCHALGAYYDALATDEDPAAKKEIYYAYKELADAIAAGNPGKGKFNAFALHDEWKNLLIDAEKFGSSFPVTKVEIGPLKLQTLDYQTKTATYYAEIRSGELNGSYYSDRYEKTIAIIAEGYKKAYKTDWESDLPGDWPEYSVSYRKDGKYNVNGALVFQKGIQYYTENSFWSGGKPYHEETYYYNAFTRDLTDYKFNIVDANGKELVKGKRFLLGEERSITFSGIKPDVMDLIDNGKAWLNPVAVYLEYGKYSNADDKGGRSFIKNFPEVQLPLDKAVFLGSHYKGDIAAVNFEKASIMIEKLTAEALLAKEKADPKSLYNSVINNLKAIPGKNFEILCTEVTQKLYQEIMGENPSGFKGDNLPVENVSWHDAVEFCNALSKKTGLTPVYTIELLNYGIDIIVKQNDSANGFRLPTEEEWEYAAKGGDNYIFAGSNNIDDVAWYRDNSDSKTHPVAQKKSNGYGLYDMNGNVWEWCWDHYYSKHPICGGCYGDKEYDNKYRIEEFKYKWSNCGFRIVRTVK
ncbi:MAG: SUMF1/EgtB/PvdO family nonheme iron enzyme [Spirochaetia bacterium]|nr:SUMF1/EgtB/PvdO family nonheme iron enzyme [Spirochaetia bacterium]